MANVIDDDRAQIILITALVLAVIFVALALVVNSAIYTENLSTRASGAESQHVLEERATTDLSVTRAIGEANAAYPAATDVEPIRDEILTISESQFDSLRLESARFGRILNVEITSTTEGSHVQQVDQSRNFTAGGVNTGDPDWRLVNGTTETGTFRLEIQEDSLLDVTGSVASQMLEDSDDVLLGGLLFNEAFHVEVTTASGDTWRMYIFQGVDADGTTEAYVYTQQPGEDILTTEKTLDALLDDSCETTFDDGAATIDLRNAEVGGEACGELQFYGDQIVGTEHNVSYRNAETDGIDESSADAIVDAYDDENRTEELENGTDTILDLLPIGLTGDTSDEIQGIWDETGIAGERATGTYDVVVDTPAEPDNFDDAGDGDPSDRTIVFSADVSTTYRTGGATLNTTEVEVQWDGPAP